VSVPLAWCPSRPDFFATFSASETGKGAAVQIHNVNHLKASATVITVAPRPHRVIDFDWLATRGTPRIAAAVGHDVLIFPISIDLMSIGNCPAFTKLKDRHNRLSVSSNNVDCRRVRNVHLDMAKSQYYNYSFPTSIPNNMARKRYVQKH